MATDFTRWNWDHPQWMRTLDDVEREYILAINRAPDIDTAHELSVGLKQYREMFKLERPS